MTGIREEGTPGGPPAADEFPYLERRCKTMTFLTPQAVRTYQFREVRLDIKNVTSVRVSRDGTEYLSTVSGDTFVIAPEWLFMQGSPTVTEYAPEVLPGVPQ